MLVELDPSKVCFLITKIREFDVQAEENEGSDSNATDDEFSAVYDVAPKGSVYKEVAAFVRAMDVDEKRELVALSLLGRGEFGTGEWTDALEAAASRPALGSVKVLLEDPLLATELEEGLDMFGLSCDDAEGA